MGFYDNDMKKLNKLRERKKQLEEHINKLNDELYDIEESIEEEEVNLTEQFPMTDKQNKAILFIFSRLRIDEAKPTNKVEAIKFINKYFEQAKGAVPIAKRNRKRSYSKKTVYNNSYDFSNYSDNNSCDGSNCSSCRQCGFCDEQDSLNYIDEGPYALNR